MAVPDAKVKCGEEQPQCGRCVRLGVRCPGYAQNLRWVSQQEQQSKGAVPGSRVSGAGELSNSRRQSTASYQGDGATPARGSGSQHSLDSNQSEHGAGVAVPTDNNLWNLADGGSMSELLDLCPSPPMALPMCTFSQSHITHDLRQSSGTTEDLSHLLSMTDPVEAAQSNCTDKVSAWRHFAPSSIVRSYPPAQSGLQASSRGLTTMSRPLNNPSWTLIEYYFKEVAALFSSYDSQMNPFRTTVSRLWGSSLAMCRTMQSMAAATLVNDFPEFGPLGRKMRDEAIDFITREPVMDDRSLLALLMLGQTASWHDPKDLGVSFFNLLRKHVTASEFPSGGVHPGPARNTSNNLRFFKEALIYWEMLLSYVIDNDSTTPPGSQRPLSPDEPLVLQRIPHPWTGIARDTQFTVQEVGRLIRRERKRVRARQFTSQDEIHRAQMAIKEAKDLEKRLLGLAHPSESEIVSPGDEDTPVWHLLTMAEVYRCTGLMQLYRVFPDLLRNRLSSSAENIAQTDAHPSNTPPPFIFTPTSPPDHPRSPASASSSPSYNTAAHDEWLTEFTITTLSRLKTIPIESRTRCLQPFLLVASCSELRLPGSPSNTDIPSYPDDINNGDNGLNDLSADTPTISMGAIEVSRTRRFILGRLTSFLHVLPPKPISVCVRLVEEVWRRMDAGRSDTYWVDVMIEKGWETTMG
ncbi:hypothetical protein N7539_006726 [Penicillium diatomitis]|uniref:Zn(2)-C6 fungal-type domain-containing protein n=1 Tax=Penicillium diatomitis TaxID=2819901 RepID=A0A9X0BSJ6_9EURO|nr:uncharacterized protein N7539_006726 [Penicillium diatomitis]KAJ5480832.1 hypothetical protein N7539_006726 [Penicillium diatomitis]